MITSYLTPYRVHGQPVCISVSLAEAASTNTILGLPFLRATRSELFFDSDAEESMVCQRLGTTFPLSYYIPLCANCLPNTGGRDVRRAFMVTPKESLQHLSQAREELHTQLKAASVNNELSPFDGPLVPGFHVVSESSWSVIPSN